MVRTSVPRRASVSRGDTEARASSSGLAPAFQQGQFDGFCGIYAAINGLRLLSGIDGKLAQADCEKLYSRAVRLLHDDQQLLRAARWGIAERRWRHIVDARCVNASRMAQRDIRATRAFPGRKVPSRPEAFAIIENAISAQRPVLVCLEEQYSHYTVINAYTPYRFVLHDSYGYQWISKDACGSGLRSAPEQRLPPVHFHTFVLGWTSTFGPIPDRQISVMDKTKADFRSASHPITDGVLL